MKHYYLYIHSLKKSEIGPKHGLFYIVILELKRIIFFKEFTVSNAVLGNIYYAKPKILCTLEDVCVHLNKKPLLKILNYLKI